MHEIQTIVLPIFLEWVSEQFLNGTSAHRRPFQCHDIPRSQPVCLSHGFTWLRCAKTAEQIEILFGVRTLGAHGWGSWISPRWGGVHSMQPLPNHFGFLFNHFLSVSYVTQCWINAWLHQKVTSTNLEALNSSKLTRQQQWLEHLWYWEQHLTVLTQIATRYVKTHDVYWYTTKQSESCHKYCYVHLCIFQ